MRNFNKLTLFILVTIFNLKLAHAQCQASFNIIDNGNGNYTFTSTSQGGNTFVWLEGSNVLGSTASFNHTFVNGTFQIHLIITNASSGCTDDTTQTITVTSGTSCVPTASFSSVNQGQHGSYYFVNNSNVPAGSVNYFWDFGDGDTINSSSNVSHSYATNGTYNVCLSIIGSNSSCSDTVCETIVVNSVTNIPCVAQANFGNLSVGSDFNFFNNSTGAQVFFWDFGDGSTSTDTNPLHTFPANTAPGITPYFVCLTATDTNTGCSNTFCRTVEVYTANCVGSIPHFTFVDNGSGNYSFTNASTGNITAYEWNFGDGSISTNINPAHTYTSNGTYTVVLTVVGPSCYDFYTSTITVGGVSNPTPCNSGFVIFPDTSQNNTVIVLNSSTGSNLSYLWDFGDGNTSTQAYPNYTYSTAGPFQLCLTVNDGNGCSSTFCDSIGSGGIILKQTPFTIDVQPSIATEINEVNNLISKTKTYPNPIDQHLNIELTLIEQVPVSVYVTDLLGKKVAIITERELPPGKNVIRWKRTSNLSGFYLLQIRTEHFSKTNKIFIGR